MNLPFESRSLPALLARQQMEPAPSVAVAAPGLPSALASVIDRCLQRDPAARIANGEALAEALAPVSLERGALRSWLGSGNRAHGVYVAWAGVFSLSFTANAIMSLKLHSFPGHGMGLQLALALAPLVPSIGYHVNRARRLFRAGFTLGDLRGAIDLAERERAEGISALEEPVSRSNQALRIATYASAAVGMFTMFGARFDYRWGSAQTAMLVLPWITTIVLAAAVNVNDVPLLPSRIGRLLGGSLRDRLWKSRVGEWIARQMGAPTTSRPVGAGVFRATEMLLGDAAGDLFAALPEQYRQRLGDLPATVAALESRAAEARAMAETLDELVLRDGGDDASLRERRDAARAQLTSTVAALEGIRLDLLRLHAGASDLAPLTTLLDAARQMAVEINQLADAEREVRAWLGEAPSALEHREPTPV